VAAQYIARHEGSWKNLKHQAQWASTLRTYAEPLLGRLLVSDIRPAHVIGVLEPIWATKTETTTRVRSRIEIVLDYAAAHGLREGPNPARWKGNLDAALPNASKVALVRHHAAIEVKEAPSFMKRLHTQAGTGARALEFAVLTAARSGEVCGATWSEIDLEAPLWTIPAARMKSGREHRVPLSGAATELLAALAGDHLPNEYLFPGVRGPAPRHEPDCRVAADGGVCQSAWLSKHISRLGIGTYRVLPRSRRDGAFSRHRRQGGSGISPR
jgi:integrase